VFDYNIPGTCTGDITTKNRASGSTSASKIALKVGANVIGGTINYDSGAPDSVVGEYRKSLDTPFASPPDRAKYAFVDGDKFSLYWKETFGGGSSMYYYIGKFDDSGNFAGFYNTDAEAAALNPDNSVAVQNAGTVTITGFTCVLDQGAKKEEPPVKKVVKQDDKKKVKPDTPVSAKDYKERLSIMNHACTARAAVDLAVEKTMGNVNDQAAEKARAEAITDEWTCYSAAAAATTQDKETACVSWTPAHDGAFNAPKVAHSCRVHRGPGVECNASTVGTTAVYMAAGKFLEGDDAAPVKEPACDAKYAKTRVSRWCRCAGWTWAPRMEQDKDSNGKLLT